MERATLIVMACLYTLGCGRGSRAHAKPAGSSDEPRAASPAPALPRGVDSAPEDGDGGAPARVRCTPDPSFPGVFDLPEASAAAEVELLPGVRELLVVSDSGHHGAAFARAIPS